MFVNEYVLYQIAREKQSELTRRAEIYRLLEQARNRQSIKHKPAATLFLSWLGIQLVWIGHFLQVRSR